MTARRSLVSLLAAVSLLGALAGCSVIPAPQADLTRYYVLTGPGLPPGSQDIRQGKLRLGLKPVHLSPYLDKIAIAVRHGTNELVYNDFARWAEPLEAGVSRALRAQLIMSPAVNRVYLSPFPFDQPRDYDIAINVIRCEGAKEGDRAFARFAVVMEITSAGDDSRLITRRMFSAPERTWDGKDYSALVQALSEDVGDLCNEVVAALPEAR